MNHRPVFFSNLMYRSSEQAIKLRLHLPSVMLRFISALLFVGVVFISICLLFPAIYSLVEISFDGLLLLVGFGGVTSFSIYYLVTYREDKICDQTDPQDESMPFAKKLVEAILSIREGAAFVSVIT